MAKTDRINSSSQNWSAGGVIISGPTKQEILKFDCWVVIDVYYKTAKGFLIVLIIWSSYLLFKISSN